MSEAPDPETLYSALINSRRLSDLRRMTYWCPSRCLLLDAIQVPDPGRVLLHQKRHKFSDRINEARSSEAGRRRNTFDGEDHWKPRTYYIGSSALDYPDDVPVMQQSLQCDHVGVLPDGGEVTITAAAFQADWRAGHAEVRIRKDGTRYPVH